MVARVCVDRSANQEQEASMTDATYAVSEVVGTSKENVGKAMQNGIDTAAKSLRHLDWFEVTSIRGSIVDSKVDHFQVTMKLGFRYES